MGLEKNVIFSPKPKYLYSGRYTMPKKKRTKGIDEDRCFTCDVVLTKGNVEWHHFPVPARCGGEYTVPLCMGCHDMVDRVPLGEWPVDWAFSAVSNLNREGKLFLMKSMSKLWPKENEK